jgi:hypothetical protein
MVSEVGESTAAINARCDDNTWPRVLLALQSGATLYRPARLTRYFTRCQDDRDPNDGIGISATRVKKLELAGVLVRVGVDSYTLGRLPEPVSVPVQVVASQLELF